MNADCLTQTSWVQIPPRYYENPVETSGFRVSGSWRVLIREGAAGDRDLVQPVRVALITGVRSDTHFA
jgi:hypothetical protein